jgi:hypothetical protein
LRVVSGRVAHPSKTAFDATVTELRERITALVDVA